MWIKSIASISIILRTDSPQGCVLSPLVYTLITNRDHYKTNLMVKFEDTIEVALIPNGDEAGYRFGLEDLTRWCGDWYE